MDGWLSVVTINGVPSARVDVTDLKPLPQVSDMQEKALPQP